MIVMRKIYLLTTKGVEGFDILLDFDSAIKLWLKNPDNMDVYEFSRNERGDFAGEEFNRTSLWKRAYQLSESGKLNSLESKFFKAEKLEEEM